MSSPRFLDENPDAIKICILYDIFKWKTIEKSYEDFRKIDKTFRISHDFHTFWFRKLLAPTERNFEKIDNRSIRLCILSDVIEKRDIMCSFKDLCELVGTRNIDFLDFDFWYYRFYQGHRDLDYCRPTVPKPLELSDLNDDVLGMIVERVDLRTQTRLRRTCRLFETLVDQRKPSLKNIECSRNYDKILLNFDGIQCYYHTKSDWITAERTLLYRPKCVEDIGKEDTEQDAFSDLTRFLRNPKLHLESLKYRNPFSTVIQNQMSEFVKIHSKTFKFSIQELHFSGQNQDFIINFLATTRPKILEKLEIDAKSFENRLDIRRFSAMEQWRQANYLIVLNFVFDTFYSFLHSARFNIQIRDLMIQDLVFLRDTFSTSPTFKWCKLSTRNKPSNGRILESLRLHQNPDQIWPPVGIFPIPGCLQKKALHFYLYPESIDICKLPI